MAYKHYHELQEHGILFDYKNSLPSPSKMIGISLSIQFHYLILSRIPKIKARHHYLKRKFLPKKRKGCVQLCQLIQHIPHYIPPSHSLGFFKCSDCYYIRIAKSRLKFILFLFLFFIFNLFSILN